jgi:hypothetical protein
MNPVVTSSAPANLISSVVDDEALILDLDTGNYFSLNPVATEIWTSLKNGHSIDDIATSLAEKYETDSTIVRNDIDELLRELTDAGLWQ